MERTTNGMCCDNTGRRIQNSLFPSWERRRASLWQLSLQSSVPTVPAVIIYWSHIQIPTEICEDKGGEVSEIYSEASIPFGSQYWACEWDSRLTILIVLLIGTEANHVFFFFIQRVLVKFR